MSFVATNALPMWEVWAIMLILIIGIVLTSWKAYLGIITFALGFLVAFPFLLTADVITDYQYSSVSDEVITLVENYPALRLFMVILLVVSIGAIIIKGINELMD